MKRSWPFLLILCVALLATGCVSKTDFNNHVAAYAALESDYNTLEAELQTWAGDMELWGTKTYMAICDIVANNGPDSKYTAETTEYCGTGTGNGEPPPPPDFGDD